MGHLTEYSTVMGESDNTFNQVTGQVRCFKIWHDSQIVVEGTVGKWHFLACISSPLVGILAGIF